MTAMPPLTPAFNAIPFPLANFPCPFRKIGLASYRPIELRASSRLAAASPATDAIHPFFHPRFPDAPLHAGPIAKTSRRTVFTTTVSVPPRAI